MKKFHEITLAEDSAFSTQEGLTLFKKGQVIRVFEEEEKEKEIEEEEIEEEEDGEEKSNKEEGKK